MEIEKIFKKLGYHVLELSFIVEFDTAKLLFVNVFPEIISRRICYYMVMRDLEADPIFTKPELHRELLDQLRLQMRPQYLG